MSEFGQNTQDRKLTAATLKNERYQYKMQYHLRDREIAHLETQSANERAEAESVHRRAMESKKLDLELSKLDLERMDKEKELLNLKLLLAQAQQATSQPGAGAS